MKRRYKWISGTRAFDFHINGIIIRVISHYKQVGNYYSLELFTQDGISISYAEYFPKEDRIFSKTVDFGENSDLLYYKKYIKNSTMPKQIIKNIESLLLKIKKSNEKNEQP